jgi:segregation and condensation protein B
MEAKPLDEPPDAGDIAAEETVAYLRGLVETLLFVTDRPLSLKELARAAKIDRKRTGELIAELQSELADRGIQVQEVAGGYCLRSNPLYKEYVRNFLAQRPVRLSRAQLETLAIVAYRQPITRPEIDDIRGVDSGPVLKGLLERELIKILGKKDEPGRPMLYGTTANFLELFSMESLNDLPTLQEFAELTPESRLKYEQVTGDEAPEGPVGAEDAEASAPEQAAEPSDDDDDDEDDEDEDDDEDDEDEDDDDEDEDDDDEDDDED